MGKCEADCRRFWAVTMGGVAALCCGLFSAAGCGSGGSTSPNASTGVALVSSSPAQGSTVPASAFPSIQFNFSAVCKEDGRTWLAARLKTASGVPCVDLWTTGNGLDAQAGKAGAISVTSLSGPECPLPAEVTELEVTSSAATIGGWGVTVPLYFDTCFVNQTLPVNYTLVP